MNYDRQSFSKNKYHLQTFNPSALSIPKISNTANSKKVLQLLLSVENKKTGTQEQKKTTFLLTGRLSLTHFNLKILMSTT